MDKFTENLMKFIEDKKIKQKTKFYYIMKKIVEILAFLFILLLNSFLFSMIFYLIKEADFDINAKLDNSFLLLIPYIWIVIFIIAITASYIYFYYKFNGYKNNAVISIGAIIFTSTLFGLGINYLSNLNYVTDDFLSLNLSSYYYNTTPQAGLWENPDDGYIFGRLKSVKNIDNKIILEMIDDRNKEMFEGQLFGSDKELKDMYKCDLELMNRYKLVIEKGYGRKYNILQIMPWHKGDCK